MADRCRYKMQKDKRKNTNNAPNRQTFVRTCADLYDEKR